MRGYDVCALVLLWIALTGSAAAIVMNDGDGAATGLNRLPVTGHVGTVAGGGLTIVYLGEGWVLTASHVGARDVEIEGQVYRRSDDAVVQIYNDDRTEADLIAFRIVGNPELPDLQPLEISAETPAAGAFAILAGAGRDRGDGNRSLAGALRRIWRRRMNPGPSWGTNTIAGTSARVTIGDRVTDAITTEYSRVEDLFATPYEAQAVSGDSGGALFVAEGDDLVLAGVLFAASAGDPYGSEPSRTFAVDLARYREQILAAIAAEKAGRQAGDEPQRAPGPEPAARFWTAGAVGAVVGLGFAVFVRRAHVRKAPR